MLSNSQRNLSSGKSYKTVEKTVWKLPFKMERMVYMKKSKMRIISNIMAAITLISTIGGINVFANDTVGIDVQLESNLYSEQEQLIYDYFENINSGNWNDWVSNYTLSVRKDYASFVGNPYNVINNVGILTIDNVQVLNVQKVSNSYAPKVYPELQNFFQNENDYECYYVQINTQVNEDNGYFENGISNHLIILVRDDNGWGIGTMCGFDDNLLYSEYSTDAVYGIGYGLISYISEPSTIDVMDEKGVIHSDEDFTDFIVNVTCNEIGNMGYSDDALKANIMAIKMCGWWAKAGTYRETYGCDIKYGDVAYKSSLDTTSDNTQIVQDAVDDLDGYYMVSSTGTNGKLFYSAYFAGTSSSSGQGTGRLRQNGSEYLATTYNYTWKQILHYYYDNSSYNNPNVGIVQIKSN